MIDWQVLWNWLSDPDTQKTLGFLGTGIAAIAGAVWASFTYFHRKKKSNGAQPATRIKADHGSIAAGRDVNMSSGVPPKRQKHRE